MQLVLNHYGSDPDVLAPKPEDAKVSASAQEVKMERGQVKFEVVSPEVIPQSLSMAKNEKKPDWETLPYSSVTNNFSQRSRLIKLALTLALPTVVVFAQVRTV
jgi:hypothetical protein